MVIYESFGYTAWIDWADNSKRITLGYYKTKEGAERLIEEMKKEKDFDMNWAFLSYQPHTVKE